MSFSVLTQSVGVVLAPLVGSIIAGLGGRIIGRRAAHRLSVFAVGLSFFLSLFLAKQMLWDKVLPDVIEISLYTWANLGQWRFQIGFLLDPLSLLMMNIVTFVSWMVHIYTIGYMHDDPGYQRFFSYISLFTFAMLMLVMSNNLLQLFFGWEGVGVVSYLLIGFWFKKESALFAGLKAFLMNRVGDVGFLLGIAVVFWLFGSLDYATIFQKTPAVAAQMPLFFTVMGFLLFIGAMAKSAQVPLHAWLPDSMEGPTPISALIHAATMVTAGVFMVARMSPLFEHSETILNFMMLIGAITCFFMGLLGIIQNDIKRVIAYSTLSQLGYMVAALGASAYAASIFHLMTHAFFKALLFLGAGSVIIAMHHEQDIGHMGGLRKWMPITYLTMLIGSLALIGFPFFSGFYSKDSIIEAIHFSTLPGAKVAYWAVLGSVFVTALYTFRLFFLVFHTTPRMDASTQSHLHESPFVVWFPLVLLSIPSIASGIYFITPLLLGFFKQSIFVLPPHAAMLELAKSYPGALAMGLHGFRTAPFWLAMAGVFTAWLFYVRCPKLAEITRKIFSFPCFVLEQKYGFDLLYERVIPAGTRAIGWLCWRIGDRALIDDLMVNGTAKTIGLCARMIRHLQSGYIYHYAFAMITGLIILLYLVL